MASRFASATVIGTGMMGPGIAAILALGGVPATILSRTEESAAEGVRKAREFMALLKEHGIAGADAPEDVSGTANFEDAVAAADIVIESAPEDMAFKQDLFARMDKIAKPDAVLASNTSGLSITAIAVNCTRPERVITAHFWNPPHVMPLVEIVKGEKTSDSVAADVHQLLLDCDKVPVIVKKDRPGQLGNRLQVALVREAVNIVAEGIADAADVDTVIKIGFGLRLPVYGIFEHQDIVGLDMVLAIQDYVAKDLYRGDTAPPLLRETVAQGDLGAKSGKGFYDWSVKDAGKVKELRDRWVREFLKSPFRHAWKA